MKNRDLAAELGQMLKESKRILFFAGSGISWDYPACLPRASDILDLAADFVLPDNVNDLLKNIRSKLAQKRDTELTRDTILNRIQPEVFYEQLWRLIGPSSIAPWNVLTSYKTDSKLQGYRNQMGPNLNHYILVFLAWKHKLPLITTNFDSLFEEAARKLKLSCKLYIPYVTSDEMLRYKLRDDEVLIWKVHGDIEAKDRDGNPSIMTTMVRITQLNVSLIKHVEEFMRDMPLCFVGYSARDLDLFRPIAISWERLERPQPIFWIDPVFSKKSEKKLDEWEKGLLDRASLVNAKTIAQSLDSLVKQNCPELMKELGDRCHDIRNFPPANEREEEAKRIRNALVEYEKSKLANDKTLAMEPLLKEYFLAIILKETGYYCEAFHYLKDHINAFNSGFQQKHKAYALLTLASLCHENSKYVQLEQYAKEAYELARSTRLLNYPLVESICLLCEAKRMQLNGRIGFNDKLDIKGNLKVWWKFRWNLVRLRGLVHPYAHTSTLLRAFLWPIHILFNPPRPRTTADISLIYAWGSYLEHKIRLNALLQGAVEAAETVELSNLPFIRRFIPGRWRTAQPGQWFPVKCFIICSIRSWLRWRWSAIRAQSERIGYAAGIANAEKYLSRHGREREIQERARRIYELLTVPTGRAILARDRGQQLLEIGDKEAAWREYKACYEESKSICNHSLVLKGLIGMYRCTDEIDKQELIRLSKEIEGEGYKDYFTRLLSRLYRNPPVKGV